MRQINSVIRGRNPVVRHAHVAALLAALGLASCVSGPTVWRQPGYDAETLIGMRVLFARLAVSNDFDDERTGIMLSGRTRSAAARQACARITEAWTAGRVTCFGMENDAPISELELLFARDQAIPARIWQSVRAESNADLLILFRPETAEAHQDLEQQDINPNSTTSTSTIVSGVYAAPIQTTNKTERTYTISAALFDLRTGKLLKRGLHSGSGSRTEKHYAGIASAPDAVPILADIMTDLGRALLED